MIKITFLIFSLISLVNTPAFASEIIIKEGDTLTKIANENNITIRQLMDENNIYDANSLKAGQIIKLPKNINKFFIHIVKKGDSLNQISKEYQIDKSEILRLNELLDPNKILIGQRIKIPSNTSIVKSINQMENIENSDISNKSDNTENLLSENWKTYGPISIDWSSWQYKNGDFIANSIHKNGKPLFIVIKCSKGILNRTGLNGEWREWISPKKDFEFELINDVCKNVDDL
tara:strand:- start:2368 stop:3063 length:696 start_codon:yes stop_codon:yes gene_type:complete